MGLKAVQTQPEQIPVTLDELHPAVQQEAIFRHNARLELDRLYRENQELKNQIEVMTRLNERLTAELKTTKEQCDYYQAYAIEFKIHTEHAIAALDAAHQKSLTMAHDTQTEPRLKAVDDACSEMVDNLNTEKAA